MVKLRIIFFTFLSVGFLGRVNFSLAYDPPIGIPDPADSFGAFGEIDRESPSVATSDNPKCVNWPSGETAGCYYVDKNSPQATNTSNIYGYPDKPRLTPPEGSLNAGALVYIHAGTYAALDSAGQNFDWSGSGTAESPIWIIGNAANRPVFQDEIAIGFGNNASYMVIENLDASRLNLRPLTDGVNVDRIIIRNCSVTGTSNVNDASGITIGVSSTGDESPNSLVSNVVIYDNEISRHGDKSGTRDQCEVYNSYHTDYVWVLNNIIHDADADGIAGSHYADDSTRLTNHYFIGGNHIYGNGENCIDLKVVDHAIISRNSCTGPFTRENGAGIVLHYGANSLPTKDAWVLFNDIYGVGSGIVCTFCNNVHFIGNLLHDLHRGPYANDPVDGTGVGFRGTTGAVDIIDNTIYDTDEGIRCNQSLSDGTVLNIKGNIISNRADASRYDIKIDGGQAYADMDYNNFYYPSGAVSIYWNGSSRNLSYMQNTALECSHCLESNPSFTNEPGNLSIQNSSPAKDANVKNRSYDDFYSLYSVGIEKDFEGMVRPQDSAWDIGAFEFAGGAPSDMTAPAAPRGLAVN